MAAKDAERRAQPEPEPEPGAVSRSLSASFSQAWKDDVGTTGCTKLTATLGVFLSLHGLNWLLLLASFWVEDVATDSEGVEHAVVQARTRNFQFVWFYTAAVCGCMLFGQLWVTLAGVAQQHRLWERHGASRDEYETRLRAAAEQVSGLSRLELLHVLVIAADFLLAVFVVFPALFNSTPEQVLGALGPPAAALLVGQILGKSRSAIVLQQRQKTAAFARHAMHYMLFVLVGQIVYGGRFAGYMLLRTDISPVCASGGQRIAPHVLPAGAQTAFVHNYPGAEVVHVRDCGEEVFMTPLRNTSANATFVDSGMNEFVLCQMGSMYILVYMMCVPIIYFTAKGQGIISRYDSAVDYPVETTHVFVLILFLVGSSVSLLVAIKIWAEARCGYERQATMYGIGFVCFFAICLLLWKDAIIAIVRGRRGASGRWSTRHAYAAFLSHYKMEAGGKLPRYRWHLGCILLKMPAISLLTGDARRVKDKLVEVLGVPDSEVFLDSDDLMDLRDLLEHVKTSDVRAAARALLSKTPDVLLLSRFVTWSAGFVALPNQVRAPAAVVPARAVHGDSGRGADRAAADRWANQLRVQLCRGADAAGEPGGGAGEGQPRRRRPHCRVRSAPR